MIIPCKLDEVFELNECYSVTSFENNILVIDDWYKNFEEVSNVLDNMAVPCWKRSENSKNFIDYYDCRPVINHPFLELNNFSFYNEIIQLLKHFFKDDDYELTSNLLEFNFFRNKNVKLSSNYQFFPHVDNFGGLKILNCVVYMDKVCSGGTALYPNLKTLYNNEEHNLFFDVSGLDKFIIESKPNRLVVFEGDIYHGGYINNHEDYLNQWRKNQILFFKVINH